MRILVAGIAGGMVIFAWGAIEHMVLPTGQAGISTLPNEEAIVGALREGIPDPGLYFFPGMDMTRKSSPAEQAAWEAKYAAGPTGVLVYHPTGTQPLAPRLLLTELGADIAAALLAAFMLSLARPASRHRILMVAFFGPVAWLSISASYWNWYRFPGAFILAEGIDQVVGWLLAGMVIAAIVKRPAHQA